MRERRTRQPGVATRLPCAGVALAPAAAVVKRKKATGAIQIILLDSSLIAHLSPIRADLADERLTEAAVRSPLSHGSLVPVTGDTAATMLESGALARSLFESSPIGMAVVDLGGGWIDVNGALLRITGYDRSDLLTRDLQSITHPDDLAEDLQLLSRLACGDIESYEMHKRYITHSGAHVWVLLSMTMVRDTGGEPLHYLAQIVDIDALYRAKAELERRDRQFCETFQSSTTGMVIISPDGRWERVNPVFASMLGTTPQTLIGRHHREFTHPDDLEVGDSSAASMTDCDADNPRFDTRFVSVDGREVWAEVALTTIDGPDGLPRQMVQVHDITDQRHAAQKLAEQAELLDLARDAIVVHDLEGRVTFWNPAAERLYGWPNHAVIGRDLYRLLSTCWPEGVTRAAVNDRLVADEAWEGELEQHRSDGHAVVVLAHKALCRDNAGRPIGVLTVNTDITERRAAERALEASERRFRSQFEHSAVGQCIRGLDDRLLSVNPALAAMLGYQANELIGVAASSLATPQGIESQAATLASVFSGEADAIRYETQLIRKDGTLLDVHFTSSAVRDDTGRPVSFISLFQDISDRKFAESARDRTVAELAERNGELLAANQVKSDLIGLLGHQINNPLSVILGCTELARDNLDSATHELSTHIATIERNANRLARTVREVLAMVAAEAGHVLAHPERILLLPSLAASLDCADLNDTVVRCPPRATCLAEPAHLEHMLVNVLTNATKYGNGVHDITITEHPETVTIAITDNGSGVDPAFRDQMFDRFARDHEDQRLPGTGLGLSIVQQLAHANGGDVTYENGPKTGSRFTITLATAGTPRSPVAATPFSPP